ncbi:MAG TPA: hypothetical protein VFZ76_06865, partial [Anaerolineales bacterium]
ISTSYFSAQAGQKAKTPPNNSLEPTRPAVADCANVDWPGRSARSRWAANLVKEVVCNQTSQNRS